MDAHTLKLRPSDRIRGAFMAELDARGIRAEQIKGTQLYVLGGDAEGVIYLKVRSEKPAFFGLRRDFLVCLLGEVKTLMTEQEIKYVIWLLSNGDGPELEPPRGWSRRFTPLLRRLRVSVKNNEQWACVFLLGRKNHWVCDGWVLTRDHVIAGMQNWSHSEKQGEYKISEHHLENVPIRRGLDAIVGATLEGLSTPAMQ